MLLREYREKKGIKQLAVADYLGISRVTYAKYEKNQGAMSLDQARAVCDFLGCSLDDIFLDAEVN